MWGEYYNTSAQCPYICGQCKIKKGDFCKNYTSVNLVQYGFQSRQFFKCEIVWWLVDDIVTYSGYGFEVWFLELYEKVYRINYTS